MDGRIDKRDGRMKRQIIDVTKLFSHSFSKPGKLLNQTPDIFQEKERLVVSHHRSRRRWSDVSVPRSGRRGSANLQQNLTKTEPAAQHELTSELQKKQKKNKRNTCSFFSNCYKAQRVAESAGIAYSESGLRSVCECVCEGHTVRLRGRGPGPLLDAVQMEDVEAAVAAPHRGHDPDDVAAHHALVLLLGQLLDQAPCGDQSAQETGPQHPDIEQETGGRVQRST